MKTGVLLFTACLTAAPAAACFGQAAPAVPVAVPPTPVVATPVPTTVLLRYKFKAGQVRDYHMSMDTNGTIAGLPGGQTMPMKQHMDVRLHQTVTGVQDADGTATIAMGMDSMTMTMNGRVMPFPASMMAQMKNIGTLVETTAGKVVSFTPSARPAGGGLPGMDFSKMGGMQSSTALPEAAVKAGDTWTNTADISGQFGLAGTSAANTTLTLAGVDMSGGTPVADITTETVADISTSATAAPPVPMAMAGKITGTGHLKFDVAAGVITQQTGLSHILMTMTPAGGQAPAQVGPMTIDMEINTRLDLAPAAVSAAANVPAAVPDPALTPRTGEVRLEGTVREIQPGQKRLVLLASHAQDAGHDAQTLDPPRPKTILVRADTTLRPSGGARAALNNFQPGDTVIVVGKSAGTGKPLVARVISTQ